MTATDPDVIDVLTTDHREAEELVAQITTTADAEQRRDLTDQLIAELVRHSVAEEMFVYPAMRDHLPNGDQAVEHDTQEHKELETLMKQLEGADTGSAEFDDALGNLRRVLLDHVRDEETDQFPQLRAHIPAAKLIDLKEKVELAKKVAPTRPHPSAPNSELFHKLVGPGVGLVDRLRDHLTNRPT
ncbi:hemerythrin HHE cation binding domain-containing protein [Kribbella voronezhensis]|uniref:Hemerythrin HHE cation binding domain-containing protein n=1 Tax=Kribbella voronezhensis TaxID=2512212 RepID=A0A4R7SXF1_9ACTN|nr:hemerythrin domain-containing protein [Kribbella voronezhensis]TDU83954.1 hemerythrin HHE cation binding domain-containing protein [Kribbella voronezhensis]